jgi:hypothetical protein
MRAFDSLAPGTRAMVVEQAKSAGWRANAPGHGAEDVAFGTLISLPRTGCVPGRRRPSAPAQATAFAARPTEVIGDGG